MKFNFYFTLLFFLIPQIAWSQEIHVTFNDGTKASCLNSKKLPAACKGADGKEFLIEANENFGHVYMLEKGEVVFMSSALQEVRVGDQTIFARAPLPSWPENSTEKTQEIINERPTHDSHLMSASNVLSGLSYLEGQISEPEALDLFKRIKITAQNKYNHAKKRIDTNDIEVETSSGRIKCSKLKGKKLERCEIYHCDSPESGYYFNTQPQGTGSFVPLNSSEQLINDKIIPKAIWHPQDRLVPLRDEGARKNEPAPIFSMNDLTEPSFLQMLNFMIDACDTESVQPFKESLLKTRKKISETKLVQLVELNNNMLSSRFITPDIIPENACMDKDVWYDGESYDHLRRLLKDASPKTIDGKTANRLFNEALAMEDIPWEYKTDGCYARAHLLARRFEEQGIHVDKVWIRGDLSVPEEDIAWSFHVAPVVYVEDENGKVERMVIDPSLNNGPVSVDVWSASMQKGVVGETSETSFPFPTNAINFERTAIAFSNSTPYLPNDDIQMSEQEKMEQAKLTMKRYREFLK